MYSKQLEAVKFYPAVLFKAVISRNDYKMYISIQTQWPSGIWRTDAGLSLLCRYHTGSLAFGSLILSLVQVIRVILEYLDHKLKGFLSSSFIVAKLLEQSFNVLLL